MWDPILGALAILGMVVVLTAAPKLVDAWCDRIRYGIQNPADDLAEDVDDEPESVRSAAAAPKAATKAAATTAGSPRTAP
ncbi:hypothetical protein C8D87_114108 [Lentzea atacamensis]|uniref:Sec-independent protein translocase protein TatA n=1 Tax=Lentzea atacamensis TaxID=531938 RepID=A0ABX9DZF4_9PSEU|nr:hypothetical protein [Lentzea atacamensis]RAS59496.1 hypothetical protein C8D87_114108 [Lentzea atacamensis]